MNEHDYQMLEFGSLILGWLLAIEWFLFCYLYDVPMKGANVIAFVLIGTACMAISFITFVKHRFYVQEMEEEIEKHRKDENGKMER